MGILHVRVALVAFGALIAMGALIALILIGPLFFSRKESTIRDESNPMPTRATMAPTKKRRTFQSRKESGALFFRLEKITGSAVSRSG